MERDIFESEYVIFGNKRICWNNFFLILFALGLMIGGLFFPDEVIKAVYPFDWFPLVFKILCFILTPIIIVALYMTWKQIKNPVYLFFANDNGFEIGIGKSIGFVKWSDVEKAMVMPFLSETEVLGIFLKNPEKYFPILRNGKARRNRIDIPSNHFTKKQWEEVKEIFQRYVKQVSAGND